MAKACRCLHYDLFLITSGALKKDAAVIKKKTTLESPPPEHRAHRNVPESSIFQVWSVRRVLVSRVHSWKLTTSAYAAMCFGERRCCAILFKDDVRFRAATSGTDTTYGLKTSVKADMLMSDAATHRPRPRSERSKNSQQGMKTSKYGRGNLHQDSSQMEQKLIQLFCYFSITP